MNGLNSLVRTALALSHIVVHLVQAASPTWVSLNVSVPPSIIEGDYNFNFVDILVGTPPQVLSLPIDMQSDALTIYSSECQFCGGNTLYDMSQSSTGQFENRPLNGTAQLNGSWVSDAVGFGGIVQSDNIDLAMVQTLSTNFDGLRMLNGDFGFLADPPRTTSITRLVPHLYESGQLLNPVVGMSLHPQNPKLTIGALDPADYDGTINWVQLEPNQKGDNLYNQFKIDGISGRNGSLVPYGDNLLAGIDSLFINIGVPNNFTFMSDTNYTGPIYNKTFNIEPNSGRVSIPCNDTNVNFPGEHVPQAYVDFAVQINGVTYMVDSQDNLLRTPSMSSPEGFCNVGLNTNTVVGNPNIWLGMPFLRSIYLAYRFPTDGCPGYYGFAFPKGANRTQTQISQTPTSTPSQMAQCLNLAAPTSTPTATRPSSSGGTQYAVYGNDGMQVSLQGAEFLVRGVWNVTS